MSSLTRTLVVIPQSALVTLLLLIIADRLKQHEWGSTKEGKVRFSNWHYHIKNYREIIQTGRTLITTYRCPQDIGEVAGVIDITLADKPVVIKTGTNIKIGTGLPDSKSISIFKVDSIYPENARRRGIEGYVIVEHTVTKQRTAEDPIVIEVQPKGIFNRAAIKSALRYQYEPLVVNGKALEGADVSAKFIFELEQ